MTLRELEARPAVGADLLLDRDGLRDADARRALRLGAAERLDARGFAFAEDAHLLGLGVRERLDLRRLLERSAGTRPCPGCAWTVIESSDSVRSVCCLRARLGLAQLALLDRGLLLARVGLDLLLGDLPRAQLGQDLLDRARRPAPRVGVPISTSSSSRL